jgi:hypothetical protein
VGLSGGHGMGRNMSGRSPYMILDGYGYSYQTAMVGIRILKDHGVDMENR